MKQFVQFLWNQKRPPYYLIASTGAIMEGRLYPIHGRWIGTIIGTEEQIQESIVLCADYDMLAISEAVAQKEIDDNDIPGISDRLSLLENALLDLIIGG